MNLLITEGSLKTDYWSDDNTQIDILLGLTRDAIRSARKTELDAIGIHSRRYALLLMLQKMGEMATPAALAQQLVRKRHTVTELLSKMEQDGFVKRFKDFEHKARVWVVITPKGRHYANLASKRESIHRVFSALNADKQKHMWELLSVIRDCILVNYHRRNVYPDISTADSDYNLYLRLIEVTDEIGYIREEELRPYQIHPRRAALLLVLKDTCKKATASEIADYVFRRRNSVSEILNKMEKDGLVKKRITGEKRNIVRFSLTPQGQEAYNHVANGHAVARIVSVLKPHDRRALVTYLKSLFTRAVAEIA